MCTRGWEKADSLRESREVRIRSARIVLAGEDFPSDPMARIICNIKAAIEFKGQVNWVFLRRAGARSAEGLSSSQILRFALLPDPRFSRLGRLSSTSAFPRRHSHSRSLSRDFSEQQVQLRKAILQVEAQGAERGFFGVIELFEFVIRDRVI